MIEMVAICGTVLIAAFYVCVAIDNAASKIKNALRAPTQQIERVADKMDDLNADIKSAKNALWHGKRPPDPDYD